MTKKLCAVHGDGPIDLSKDAECDVCAANARRQPSYYTLPDAMAADFADYLGDDLAKFEEWRSWPSETVATYVACLRSQWEHGRG